MENTLPPRAVATDLLINYQLGRIPVCRACRTVCTDRLPAIASALSVEVQAIADPCMAAQAKCHRVASEVELVNDDRSVLLHFSKEKKPLPNEFMPWQTTQQSNGRIPLGIR